MLAVQQAGGTSLIATKFDASQAARDIVSENVTVMSEFAPMLDSIVIQSQPGQLASLRAVTELDTPSTIERFETECPNATFWSTFGPRSQVAGPMKQGGLPECSNPGKSHPCLRRFVLGSRRCPAGAPEATMG
jgi:hypothetical protein